MDKKEISEKIPNQKLRRALEELRDTKNEHRAQELKKVISIRHALLVMPQRDVHEHVAHGSFKADHQRLNVFAALVAFLGGDQHRRMHAEVEALVVERRDGVAHNLVGEFEDGLFDQRVGFGQFSARVVAGHTHRGLRLEVEDDAALDVSRKLHHAGHAFAAIGILFHRKVVDLCGG